VTALPSLVLLRLLALGLLTAFVTLPGAARPALARDVQDDILAQTAAVRGLQPKAPVPFAFVDSSSLRQNLLGSLEDEAAVRELEISRKLLVLLGLFNPDADLQSVLIELYAENVVGYYSSRDKQMYLVSGSSVFGPEQKVTLAHEFTHALQDQYFDLRALQSRTERNGDYSLALEALIEGDATLTMVLYARFFLRPDELTQLQTASSSSSLERAPLVVRDEISFPYNEGALFVLRLWQEGGFEAVNRAFFDPPRSTEQVLHPDRYLAREAPIDVSLPDLAAALGPEWQQLRSDVLGELDVRILLQQFIGREMASSGAQGWGGDRFALLENTAGQNALVVSTAWDDEAEAGEFFNAYAETVVRRYGRRATRTQDAASKIVWSTPNGSLVLQKWGTGVVIVMAPESLAADSLVAAIAAGAPPRTQPGSAPVPVQLPRRIEAGAPESLVLWPFAQ
jgi:hypothetical protein